MVRFTRLNLSKSKAVGTFLGVFNFNSTETEKQALGKHHYDDSEIKAVRLSCAIGRKGRNALALRAKLLNGTDSLRKSYSE